MQVVNQSDTVELEAYITPAYRLYTIRLPKGRLPK
jgi:hypothetical protein